MSPTYTSADTATYLRPHRGGQPVAYFAGHSLGLQPDTAAAALQAELERWATLGVDGHFAGDDPWMGFHESLAGPLAAICGALPEEVSVQNTLSVNIHLLLASFYRPKGRRTKILMEAPAFPSDQYAVETHLRFKGLDDRAETIVLEPDAQTMLLGTEHIVEAIRRHADELALVYLGGVQYISGEVLDIGAIAQACQELGIVCGFDLAHAAGNVPLDLHTWGVDFACGCTYKYLNGGPGALGWLYVQQRHLADGTLPRLAGWWGYRKDTRFKMQPGFEPIPTADGWALSNPPILSMAPLKASLPPFAEIGMQALWAQGQALVGQLREVFADNKDITLVTPKGVGSGNMLTIRMADRDACRALFERLQAGAIVPDWREPGIIRLACCPLYTTAEDIGRVNAILN